MLNRAKWFASLFLLVFSTVEFSEAKNGIFPSDLLKAKFKESNHVGEFARASRDLNSRPIDEYCKALCERIYSNWEGPDKNPKHFRIHMFIDNKGYFSNIAVKNNLATEQGLFSCYEAVSSVSGFRSAPAGIYEVELNLNADEATKADYFAKFVHQNSSHTGQIVWHRIPLESLQCNTSLKRSLVRSADNLRCGSKAEFDEIQKSWIEFFRSTICPSEQQIVQHANIIDKQKFF